MRHHNIVSWKGQVVKLSEYPRNCWRDLPPRNKQWKTKGTRKETEVAQRMLPPFYWFVCNS